MTTTTDLADAIERLHHRFRDLASERLAAAGVRGLTPAQALILLRLGDGTATLGELGLRGCYMGTNISHNVAKLVRLGYLRRERAALDGRVAMVALTEDGLELLRRLQPFYPTLTDLTVGALTEGDATHLYGNLARIDRAWLGARAPAPAAVAGARSSPQLDPLRAAPQHRSRETMDA